MQRGEEPIAAAEVLLPVYESAGDWPKVAAVYEVMVACTQEPARRVELLDLLAKHARAPPQRFRCGV